MRVNSWDGEHYPRPGDFLQAARTLYEILEVRGRSLVCRVVPLETRIEDGCRLFAWKWGARKRNSD